MNEETLELIADTAKARITDFIRQHGPAGEVATLVAQAIEATALLVSN